jgi:glycosyltransferase involved in cell wall biosynthesis
MLEKVQVNLSNTIGITYEVVVIENSKGGMGICEAYNRGVDMAVYDVFCFMHEDVHFDTVGWGQRVIEHLSDPSIGLIGLAGGDTKSWVPSSWPSYIHPSEISIIQHKRGSGKQEHIVRSGYPDEFGQARPAACIDGVWMCTRKDVLQKYRFDEKTLRGFHAYDIDFSLQVGQTYKVCVVFDIIMHHFSEGSFDRIWLNNARLLSDKWRTTLPVTVRYLSHGDFVHQHWSVMRNYIYKLFELKYSRLSILWELVKYSRTRYFHLLHFLHFVKMTIIYNPDEKGNSRL